MQRSSSWTRYALLATLALAGPVFAVPPANSPSRTAPAPGEISKAMPEGMDLYTSLAISDSKQVVGTGNGMGAAEAKVRARKDCQDSGATDCVELITFPVRNHCMALAVDKGAKPGVRAIFASSAQAGTPEAAALGKSSMDKCVASGAKQCGVTVEHCL